MRRRRCIIMRRVQYRQAVLLWGRCRPMRCIGPSTIPIMARAPLRSNRIEDPGMEFLRVIENSMAIKDQHPVQPGKSDGAAADGQGRQAESVLPMRDKNVEDIET